jgi:hypothetical protein
MTIPLGILAAAGVRGISSAAFVASASAGLTWPSADLGAAASNRYIVITATYRVGVNSSNQNILTCSVGGVALTRHAARRDTNGTQTSYKAIFGGYVPTGTTANVVFTLQDGSDPGSVFDCSSYRLIGDGIKLLDTQNSGGSPLSFTTPAKSTIIGVAATESGTTAITWTGLTRDVERDRGSWRYSSASQYYTASGNRSVDVANATGAFVALG